MLQKKKKKKVLHQQPCMHFLQVLQGDVVSSPPTDLPAANFPHSLALPLTHLMSFFLPERWEFVLPSNSTENILGIVFPAAKLLSEVTLASPTFNLLCLKPAKSDGWIISLAGSLPALQSVVRQLLRNQTGDPTKLPGLPGRLENILSRGCVASALLWADLIPNTARKPGLRKITKSK